MGVLLRLNTPYGSKLMLAVEDYLTTWENAQNLLLSSKKNPQKTKHKTNKNSYGITEECVLIFVNKHTQEKKIVNLITSSLKHYQWLSLNGG